MGRISNILSEDNLDSWLEKMSASPLVPPLVALGMAITYSAIKPVPAETRAGGVDSSHIRELSSPPMYVQPTTNSTPTTIK